MKHIVLVLFLLIGTAGTLTAGEEAESYREATPQTASLISIDSGTIRQLQLMIAHIKAAKQAMEHLKCLRSNNFDPFQCLGFELEPVPGPIDTGMFETMSVADREYIATSMTQAENERLDSLLAEVNALRDEIRD